MDIWSKIGVIAAITLAALALLGLIYLIIIWFAVGRTFSQRQKRNPLLRYFTAEDFPDLSARAIEIKNKQGKKLRGFLYFSATSIPDTSHLIIFFHGWGMGHLAYTKEIRTLTLMTGFPVLAMDYQGCDLSDGRTTGGFYHPLQDAKAMINYALNTLRARSLHLVGHSWGGFVAANIASYFPTDKIKSITAISAPESYPVMMRSLIHGRRLAQSILMGFSYIRFGQLAHFSTDISLFRNKIPTLIIHGKIDPLVTYDSSAALYAALANRVDYIRPLIFRHKGHNPYLTIDAELALVDMLRRLQNLKKAPLDEQKNFASKIDYDRLGQDDKTVFDVILQLIKEAEHGPANR